MRFASFLKGINIVIDLRSEKLSVNANSSILKKEYKSQNMTKQYNSAGSIKRYSVIQIILFFRCGAFVFCGISRRKDFAFERIKKIFKQNYFAKRKVIGSALANRIANCCP
jgi:hypothetical protein